MNEITKTQDPAYWGVLPSEVRYDTRISSTAKVLYAEITALTKAHGYCYADNDYFCRLFGLSERTIIRLIQLLADTGFIAVTGEQTTSRRIYSGVNPLAKAEKDGFVFPREGKHRGKRVRASDKNVTPSDKNVTPNLNVKENQEEETDPPKAPQGAGADFVQKSSPDWKPERFESFWKFYPLHKSKQAAIRAWDRLKPSDELLAVIGRTLKRQIAEAERHGDPWKLYASTYLNNARWTDEPEAAPAEAAPQRVRKDLMRL